MEMAVKDNRKCVIDSDVKDVWESVFHDKNSVNIVKISVWIGFICQIV